jgi:hypothetical protein
VLAELPAGRLGLLVDVLRAFAQRWHDACRRGVGISKRIYGATVCACGQQVGLVRAGEKNRITYFCPKCQSREASLQPQIPRRSGTLLGWLQDRKTNGSNCSATVPDVALEHGNNGAATDALGSRWSCGQCTLSNDPAFQRCAACRGLREAGSTVTAETGTGPSSAQVGTQRTRPHSEDAPEDSRTHGIHRMDSANSSKRQRSTESSMQPNGTISSAAADGGLRLAAPTCRCRLTAKLQRVRKAGVNHGRLFWSCPKRQGQSCGAFIWADSRFPSCLCTAPGRKKALLRRVLKAGPSNGRYFFSCANGKSKPAKTSREPMSGDGCGFFSWENEHPHCWDVAAAPVVLPL